MVRVKQPFARKTVVHKTPRKAFVSKSARKGAPAGGGVIRRRRYRPGTLALRAIRHYQKSTALLIPKAPFKRLVRGILREYNDTRIQLSAVTALQVFSLFNNQIIKWNKYWISGSF